jgi:hypothetical protein
VPHLPQLFGSVWGSEQVPLQLTGVLLAHAHRLDWHTRLLLQATPHEPQFDWLVARLTQLLLPHITYPDPHRVLQVPLLHSGLSLEHPVPQLPQLELFDVRSTQLPSPKKPMTPFAHWVWPAGHSHVPLTHETPPGQTVPHDPQFRLSVAVFVHAVKDPKGVFVVHDFWLALHALHIPLTQLSMLGGQLFPQEPQLLESVCVSVHEPLHIVSPVEQVQFPALQVPPAPHELSHLPQFLLSVCTSTQELPLQAVSGGPESVVQSAWHLPFAQKGLPFITEHVMPHPPQLFGSLWIAVHAPPLHSASPGAQAHWLIWQVFDWLQCVPQPPQFKLSFCSSTQLIPHWVRPAVQPHTPALHV